MDKRILIIQELGLNFKIVKAILHRGKEHGETAVLKNMIYKLSKQLSKEQASRLGSGKQLLYFR